MITFIDDGFWCNKCRRFHPTLHWHDRYDDYAKLEMEEKKWKEKTFPQFFQNTSWEDTRKIMLKNIESKPYKETDEAGKCCICGNETHFVDRKTNDYVCSDACLYAHKRR